MGNSKQIWADFISENQKSNLKSLLFCTRMVHTLLTRMGFFFLMWSALILYLAILYVNDGLTIWSLQLQMVIFPNTASLCQLPRFTGYLSIDKGMFHFNKTSSNNCDGHNSILDWENLFRAKNRLKLLWFMFSSVCCYLFILKGEEQSSKNQALFVPSPQH